MFNLRGLTVHSDAAYSICSGLILLIIEIIKDKKYFVKALHISSPAFLISFFSFLGNYIGFYVALDLCDSRDQTVVIGAINYLWGAMTVILSIPILKRKVKSFWFLVGIIITIIGTLGISLYGSTVSPFAFSSGSNFPLACLFAFGAALSWGAYSNFLKKYFSAGDVSRLPVFLTAGGIIIGICGFISNPHSSLQSGQMPMLIYNIFVPGLLASVFWDAGIRNGNTKLVTFFSEFMVVLSTVASSFIMKIPVSMATIIFCLLLGFGALLCKKSELRIE